MPTGYMKKLAYNRNSRIQFYKSMGIDRESLLGLPETHPFSEETVTKVRTLLGPHAYTMLKAWEAQNGKAD